jgi:hypothetical protein
MIMKTHCKVLFGAMAFVVASFSGSMAGLTVNNGTASGDENGTLVTVTAAPRRLERTLSAGRGT